MKRVMQLLLSIALGYFIPYIFLVLSALIFGGFLFGSTMSRIDFIMILAFFFAPYGTGIALIVELIF